jgi:acetyl esterase
VVAGWGERFPSRDEFDGLVIDTKSPKVGDAYTSGRDLNDDPCVAPLHAESLAGLPPAIVVLGGCDPLRDEGRLYAGRLHDDGVAVEEMFCAGQPHGFVNFGFPAAAAAFERIGAFVRGVFARQAS